MIETKEQIIEHFKSGSKDKSNLKIGVEHEKFIFDKKQIRELIIPKSRKCLKIYMSLAGNLFLRKKIQ